MTSTDVRPLFVYGTLRDPELRALVLGPDHDRVRMQAGRLKDHTALRAAGEDYPLLVPSPGSSLAGDLIHDLSAEAMARIRFFEGASIGPDAAGDEYVSRPVTVETETGPVQAQTFFATEPFCATDGPWSHDDQTETERALLLECTREYMDHVGRLPADGFDIWTGIVIRARARVRAARETVTNTVRHGFGRADVDAIRLTRPYAYYFGVEEHLIRFRRFDGSMSEPILRASFVSGDAATVLPWDPRTDRVLLVEQWRAGPWVRGDKAPWLLEAIAGRVDAAESPETTVRREAMEEAAVTLGRIETVAAYYSSPGTTSEKLFSYVGEADLADAGGIHGLASEHENIRALTLPFDEAVAAAESGEGANSHLLLTLYWLAVHRDRLRHEWSTPAP